MQRELTYQIPFSRLTKLSKTMSRKVYQRLWWTRWILFAAFILIISFSDAISDFSTRMGAPIPVNLIIFGMIVLTLIGVLQMRRSQMRQAKSRSNFDQIIRLAQDDGGIHFKTDDIEYYLKWQGITQMLIEPDGLVLSHGGLFFLVPDTAFFGDDERRAFRRHVYDHLTDEARSLSATHMEPEIALPRD